MLCCRRLTREMVESIECTAENWKDVCAKLHSTREEYLDKFDDNCFYVAYANWGHPRDLVFWRLNDELTKQWAELISDAGGTHFGFKYGWLK